jgi:DNA-binding CsgD family transcriptional regulator
MLVEGSGDREIGSCLGISYEAARSRSKALRRKLGAGNRAQVVAKALQLGLGRLTGG